MDQIALFEHKEVRRTWDEERQCWLFSIVDVIAVLADNDRPRKYWSDLKKKLAGEGSELSEKIGQLKMRAADGKMRQTDVADTEQLLRLIQSIPSPKAEPFKLWLAHVGYERIQEIEDPEIAAGRAQELYRAKGYSEDWIALRARGIATRAELTDEWQKRGVERTKDYAVLTAEISKAAFGMTPSEYKSMKGLKNENLRDHMTTLELLFSELSEAATTEITRNDDALGLYENRLAAQKGGKIAGDARKNLEEQTGRAVSTTANYKHLSGKKRKKIDEEGT